MSRSMENRFNKLVKNTDPQKIADGLTEFGKEAISDIFFNGKPDDGNEKLRISYKFLQDHMVSQPSLLVAWLVVMDYHLLTLQEMYEEDKFNTEIRVNQNLMESVAISILIEREIKLYKETGNDEILDGAQQFASKLYQSIVPHMTEMDIALEHLKKIFDKFSLQESEFIVNLVKDRVEEVRDQQ